ncbi:hypothetical protein D3C73_1210080 [compost metagenome]
MVASDFTTVYTGKATGFSLTLFSLEELEEQLTWVAKTEQINKEMLKIDNVFFFTMLD